MTFSGLLALSRVSYHGRYSILLCICKVSQNLCTGARADFSIPLRSASTSLVLSSHQLQHQSPTHSEDYGSSLVYAVEPYLSGRDNILRVRGLETP